MTEEIEDDGWITLYPPMDLISLALRTAYDRVLAEPVPDDLLAIAKQLDAERDA